MIRAHTRRCAANDRVGVVAVERHSFGQRGITSNAEDFEDVAGLVEVVAVRIGADQS
jgi:hypothetical protein